MKVVMIIAVNFQFNTIEMHGNVDFQDYIWYNLLIYYNIYYIYIIINNNVDNYLDSKVLHKFHFKINCIIWKSVLWNL